MKLFDPNRPKVNSFPALCDKHGNATQAMPWPLITPLSKGGFEVRAYVLSMKANSYRHLTAQVSDVAGFYAQLLEDPEKVFEELLHWDFSAPSGRRDTSTDDLAEALGL